MRLLWVKRVARAPACIPVKFSYECKHHSQNASKIWNRRVTPSCIPARARARETWSSRRSPSESHASLCIHLSKRIYADVWVCIRAIPRTTTKEMKFHLSCSISWKNRIERSSKKRTSNAVFMHVKMSGRCRENRSNFNAYTYASTVYAYYTRKRENSFFRLN